MKYSRRWQGANEINTEGQEEDELFTDTAERRRRDLNIHGHSR
jgi:hypothetical protein